MSKLIFITGLPDTGKSAYIQKHFVNRSEYYVFDLSLQGKRLFGSPMALEDEDKIADIYNQTSEEALFALMDGKHLVIEFGKGAAYHDDFERIKNMALGMGLRVEQKHLEGVLCHQEDGSEHYSSFLYAYESLEVLEGVLESYEINQELDTVLELATEEGFLKILSMRNENGETVFFYVSEKTEIFDFEPLFEFEKMDGVHYRKLFHSFNEVLVAMVDQFSVRHVSPLMIGSPYEEEFQKIYQHLLHKGNTSSSLIDFSDN